MKVSNTYNLSKTKSKNKITVFNISFNFQSSITRALHFKLNQRLNFSNKFRSFFGFIRPKQFVTKVRFQFLTHFSLNPKPRTLQHWVSSSKKYTATAVETILLKNPKNTFVSKSYLKLSLNKQFNRVSQNLKFNLFRHKVFRYTTSKKSTISTKALFNTPIQSVDLRTGLSYVSHQINIPNVETISTYNWKYIN